MRMQVILDSPFARPGSAPIGGGKKGEFRDWTNYRVFLSRNYRLIVAPRKFDVLKTNMLVLRTSNFQGATIRPIIPRHKHSIVFIVHH